jgi:serine/threonine-protein kinase
VLRSSPPSGIVFWYRESPGDLARVHGASLGDWLDDPPNSTPGMARIGLDPDGRLLSLLIVPGERTTSTQARTDADWTSLLRATGVDESTLQAVAPEWAPPVFADRRLAWTGSWQGKEKIPVRIEAASTEGVPVSLRIIEPWTRPAESPAPEAFWSRAARLTEAIWPVVVIIAAGFVALRNVRAGRGDRRGALRLALYIGTVRMSWILGAHHMASSAETALFLGHLSYAMQRVGLAWIFYLAVEPYARRLWPRMLVSWVRVLDGRFRDPLVGRDLLLGSAAGAFIALSGLLSDWIPASIDGTTAAPLWTMWSLESLRGAVPALAAIMGIHTTGLIEVFYPVTTIVILRLLLRRTGPAIIVTTLIGLVMFYPDPASITGYLVSALLLTTTVWLVLFRVGLLAFATTFSLVPLMEQLPLAPQPAAWRLWATLLSLAFIVAPAIYGFWISRAGRPLLRDDVLERVPAS